MTLNICCYQGSTCFKKILLIIFSNIFCVLICFGQSNQNLLAPAKLGGLWGYINTKGEWIISPQYGHANNFYNNLAEVVIYENDKIISGFINNQNKLVIRLPEINYSNFSEGMLPYFENESYGFMDSVGNKIIPAQFKYCSNFENGRAMVVFKSGKAGYINKTKKLLISPRWDTAFSFHSNHAIVGKRDHHGRLQYGIIDQYGKHLMPVHFSFISQLSEEKAFANKGGIYDNGSIRGGKWFILNLKNNSMLSLCDSSVSLGIDHFATYLKFVNGVTLFPSQYKGNILFGLMDAKGEWVVLPKYKIVNCINEDRAAVFADGKMGFIDTKGKNVLPFNYDLVGTYHNEIVWYKEGKKFGFLNYNGEIVIPAKFEEVGDFYAVK